MPTICMFRGIKIYINYRDHQPPHFHASYGDYECSININEIELMTGEMPNKQLKMLFGWTALSSSGMHPSQRGQTLVKNYRVQVKNIIEIKPTDKMN